MNMGKDGTKLDRKPLSIDLLGPLSLRLNHAR
jgi:hypothetical protein